ncbi:DUF6053 domain-containing protein [Lysobacter yananisis]
MGGPSGPMPSARIAAT